MSKEYLLIRKDEKGISLVAKLKIPKGKTVIKDLAIPLDEEEYTNINKTKLCEYVYTNLIDKKQHYLCFGDSAFINHSETPNIEKEYVEDNIGMWLYLRAKQDICEGDELTIRYTNPLRILRERDHRFLLSVTDFLRAP